MLGGASKCWGVQNMFGGCTNEVRGGAQCAPPQKIRQCLRCGELRIKMRLRPCATGCNCNTCATFRGSRESAIISRFLDLSKRELLTLVTYDSVNN